jgi:class 3 adenylate cyclase
MVLDMSGFTLLTRTDGILKFLGMVRRMQAVTRPIVEGSGGAVVKSEADNLYAVFAEVKTAIEAAIRINIALDAQNFLTEDTKDIYASVGIAWGEILLIPGRGFYGDAVNLASKLGEDPAEPGEILVDVKAWERIEVAAKGESALAATEVDFSISGIDVRAFRVGY